MKAPASASATTSRLKPRNILLVTLSGIVAGAGSAFLRPQDTAAIVAPSGDRLPRPAEATVQRNAMEKPGEGPAALAETTLIKPGNLQRVERKIEDEMDEMKRSDLGNGKLYQGLLRTPDAPSLRAHGIDAAKFKQLQDINDQQSRQCFKAMHDRMQRDPARSDPEHGVLAWIIPGDPAAAAEMKAALRDQLAAVAGPELADEIAGENVLQGMFGYFGAADTLITVELPTDDVALGKKRYTYSESQGRDLGRVTFSYRNPETNRADNGAQMDATPEGISSFYGDFFTDLLNP